MAGGVDVVDRGEDKGAGRRVIKVRQLKAARSIDAESQRIMAERFGVYLIDYSLGSENQRLVRDRLIEIETARRVLEWVESGDKVDLPEELGEEFAERFFDQVEGELER